MKAYSLDLRHRVVQAYEQGQGSIPEIATRFGVGTAFVKRCCDNGEQPATLRHSPTAEVNHRA
jgi:transposase